MGDVVDSLGAVGMHDRVTVELDDGSTVEGRAGPVNFSPNERLRIELQPEDGDERYELSATVEDDEWTPVRVRRQEGDEEWEPLGEIASVTHDEDDDAADPDGEAP